MKRKALNTKKETKAGKLERLVSLVVLENRQGVKEFLEERNAFIGTDPRQMVRGVMVAIGIGGEETLREFLDLHPHKELFTTSEEEADNGINLKEAKSLLASPVREKRKQRNMMPRWAKFLGVLLFLLVLFVLVFIFVKKED
jgi:hypothetical protein